MKIRSHIGILYTTLRKQISSPRQFWKSDGKATNARILIVAPGEKRMPVEGWGAVESICLDLYEGLKSRGESVALLNSWNFYFWLTALMWKPKIVINHYDIFSRALRMLCRLLGIHLVSLSHYGYASFPELWSKETRSVMQATAAADLVICLSPRIREVWSKEFDLKNVSVLPNYVDTRVFAASKDRIGRFICVGKVEPRKRQVDLAKLLPPSIRVDFVGDIVDPRFHSLPLEAQKNFLGPWDKATLQQRLSGYEYLVLPSDGEADALVLYEGQAAGLGLICTPEAVGAQNVELDWIHVGDWSELTRIISAAPELSPEERDRIKEYAQKNYSLQSWLDAWQHELRKHIDK